MSQSVSAKINTNTNAKNILWVLFLGGVVAASCALPGYETDPNLKDTSSTSVSSSSSSGTTSGGGKGGAGQGGQIGTGGAGGADPGAILVDCAKAGAGPIAPGGLCDAFIADVGTETCMFVGPKNTECCAMPMKCVPVPNQPKHKWEPITANAQCITLPADCPYVCGQGLNCAAFTGVEPSAECKCIQFPPSASGEKLPDCIHHTTQETCAIKPTQASFARLTCTATGEAFGAFAVTQEACCDPATSMCGNNLGKSCDPGPENFPKPGQCILQ